MDPASKIIMLCFIALGMTAMALIIAVSNNMELQANFEVANQNFQTIEDALNDLYSKHPEQTGGLENVEHRG